MSPLQPAGPFTAGLWRAAEPVLRRTTSSAFYRGLATGSLPAEAFGAFLRQDALYLRADTEAIRLTSALAPEGAERAFFAGLAAEGIELERALHERLAADFNTETDVEMNPACRAYSEYLLNTARSGSYAESAAALLPCYWLYQSAGLAAHGASEAGGPYADWLETYAGDEFTACTIKFIAVVEKIASRSDSEKRAGMRRAFMKSTGFEFEFITPYR